MNDVIRNPILPGFHPDPSIVRVGDDYYLATSTFEWCPGIRLHHSRDLRHWRTVRGIADEPRLLDLSGVPDSGGVWAPDLTYAHGRFHLVYGVLDNYAHGTKDCANYLITATDPEGPWTDPVRLPGRGFDAALYHDQDGSWLLNMIAVPRPGRSFCGIEIQHLADDGTPDGDPHRLLDLTTEGLTEGPHLYRKDGRHYLLVAEGGTGFNHGALVARSTDLLGPYEIDPNGPLITSRDKPELPLQKAGHGSLVETTAGQWYLTYLAARPYTESDKPVSDGWSDRDATGRCVLGRETAIAPVTWVDGWPRIDGAAPAIEVPAPDLTAHPWPDPPVRDDFDGPELDPRWSTLRRHAAPDWVDLATRGSHLRLRGGQSALGRRTPSLIAQRVAQPHGRFEAAIEYTPITEHQSAGVVAYYNAYNWHYLEIASEDGERVLSLATADDGRRDRRRIAAVGPRLGLRIMFDGPKLRFAYRDDAEWIEPDLVADATILSDEYARRSDEGGVTTLGFTGAFVGLWAQDLADEGGAADFDYAEYHC